MASKVQEINGCKYEFVKQVPSDTKVSGWHVRIDGNHYVVLLVPVFKSIGTVSAYKATRLGRAEYDTKPYCTLRTNEIQEGVDELLKILGDAKPKTEKKEN